MAHRIAVAVYNGLLGFEYGIAAEIFGLRRPGLGVEWYDFLPCRVEDGILTTSHGMTMEPAGTLADLESADTVLVPGWRVPPAQRPPEPFLAALRRANDRGARLVSICTGAFALGHAGLLDGRRATTHWVHAESFRRTFPNVLLEEDALYVHDGRLSTSAGSAAGLDLCLSILRRDFGVAVANQIARRMVAPAHREGGQSQYVEPTAPVPNRDGFGPILDWMLENLEIPLSVDEAARRAGLSSRTFQRRFHEITGLSPHRWLSQQRVAKARDLLETTQLSVEQVATQSGLGSAANLRKHLARSLGTTPRAYRAAFRGESGAAANFDH